MQGHIEPRLVAVSKTKPIEHIIGIYQQGQRHFGENYVQELIAKSSDVGVGILVVIEFVFKKFSIILIFELFMKILEKCQDIKWHFIGHIQTNKVSKVLIAPGLHVIETIDSQKLASAVNDGWKKLNKESRLKIMVQVNTSNEKG